MANKNAKPSKENSKNTKKVKNEKNKKSFWKDFKAELKKVVWLSPKQLANNTIAVLTIVLLTALIVFVLDLSFEAMNKYGVNQLKKVISTSNTVENSNNETENTAENTGSADTNETPENQENQEQNNESSNEENNNQAESGENSTENPEAQNNE